jgi:hypothetical protein
MRALLQDRAKPHQCGVPEGTRRSKRPDLGPGPAVLTQQNGDLPVAATEFPGSRDREVPAVAGGMTAKFLFVHVREHARQPRAGCFTNG